MCLCHAGIKDALRGALFHAATSALLSGTCGGRWCSSHLCLCGKSPLLHIKLLRFHLNVELDSQIAFNGFTGLMAGIALFPLRLMGGSLKLLALFISSVRISVPVQGAACIGCLPGPRVLS